MNISGMVLNKTIRTFSAALLLTAAFTTTASSAFEDLPDRSPTLPRLLLITGNIDNPNRTGINRFDDAMMHYQGRRFSKAHEFDLGQLDSLPQKSFDVRLEFMDTAMTVKGPRLVDVLDAAGVPHTATINLVALDDYYKELSPDLRASHEWIVATSANGQPFNIGGRGPVWIMHPTQKEVATDTETQYWAFAVYLIESY